jgi:hypothetical protein
MRRLSTTATFVFALVGLVLPASRAAETTAHGSAESDSSAGGTGPESSAAKSENASAALIRATAAYDYGDLNQMVDAARPVAEGLLPASPEEQTQAFRLLGIGLYLTNRPTGAETAFIELLRRDPKARLDRTTTRPEVVAFFENLRRQNVTDPRRLIWNFIPPFGQFQNDESTKGWIIVGVGVASFAGFAASDLVLRSWQNEDGSFSGANYDNAKTVKVVNWIGAGLLAATYIYGVLDGLVGYSRPLDDSKSQVSLKVSPHGAGLGFAF